jgi:Subtilase family
MTAPESETRHLILPTETASQPAELDRINTLLETAGLGRPLREPATGTGQLVRVPLAPGADRVAVQDALLRLNRDGNQGVPAAMRDVDYTATTVEDGAAKQFLAAGKRTGFATIAWRAVDEEQMWAAPASSGTSRPVVALLDTEIHEHRWLTTASGAPCSEPADWSAPLTIVEPSFTADGENLGSHYGHATFIAGRIRLIAPAVKILSFKVMSRDGKVSEANLNGALQWLVDHPESNVDVVLMAMGRQRDAADDDSCDFQRLVTAIKTLAARGVKVVASAGNGHCNRPVVPAALATQTEHVYSVGAGTSPNDHAKFSNYGEWVTKWRPGTDLISLMPLRPSGSPDSDGYAEWSGTSFSAADYAGYLAAQVPPKV